MHHAEGRVSVNARCSIYSRSGGRTEDAPPHGAILAAKLRFRLDFALRSESRLIRKCFSQSQSLTESISADLPYPSRAVAVEPLLNARACR
jgi:hypothetical protein